MLLSVLAAALLALSGCTSDDGAEEPEDHMDGHMDDHMDGHMEEIPTRLANMTSNVTNGFVGETVGFTVQLLEVAEFDNETFNDVYFGNYSYEMSFGEGESSTGEGVGETITIDHVYQVDGTFLATILVTFPDGGIASGEASINMTIPEPPRQLPEESQFSFGPHLGCIGEAGCVSMHILQNAGGTITPDQVTGTDGHWQELNEEYWGLNMMADADNQLGDSDCEFFDADFASLGNAHNGGSECEGTIPAGTIWMLVYSWGEPALGITVEVSLP